MATSPITYPNAYQDLNTSNPRKIGAQALQGITNTGNQLFNQQNQAYNQGVGQSQQTQDYLGNIMNPLAQGQGGYSPSEVSQIELTPQQQQNIVSTAGNTAGAATQAGADAATRAANASGGSPAAVAAYRARAAQQSGAQAGNAATAANVAAQQAGAQGAENVGQARMGQQGQALGYYGNLQSQQNQNAQNALQQQGQTYATQTSGVNNASSNALKASQTPSTFDQIMGGVAGGLTSFLDEGEPMADEPGVTADFGGTPEYRGGKPADYLNQGGAGRRQAVVGEGGHPEAVVKVPKQDGRYVATAVPMQVPKNFLDAGDGPSGPLDSMGLSGYAPGSDSMGPPDAVSQTVTPYSTGSQQPSFWQRIKNTYQQNQQQNQGAQPTFGKPAGTTPSNIGNTVGSAIGTGARDLIGMFMDEGGIPESDYMSGGAIFTKPTKLSLDSDEAVVPLSYKPNAKTRPSMALPLVNKLRSKDQPHQSWT